MNKRYDIFCRVVDNFGDIGICWRLAKQMQAEHGLQVRLFVDDMQVAAEIIPNLDASQTSQTIAQIEIVRWDVQTTFESFADAVIEAFGCELPSAYIAQMPAKMVWVNLEYLSAEPWVEGFHGRYSDFGVVRRKRYFFYPGFTANTGGLLREKSLSNRRRGSQPGCGFQGIVLPNDAREALQISLFCYPHAPMPALLQTLANAQQKSVVYVSAPALFSAVQAFVGIESLQVGATCTKDSLTVVVLPFLGQDAYDALLAHCDLNFVRGEDSWVRAIWAGKPFIWQPYWQEEDTHLDKLHAFLALFYTDFAQKDMVWKAHECWLSGRGLGDAMQAYLPLLPAIQAHTAQQSAKLSKQNDLASNLVIFIENLMRTRV